MATLFISHASEDKARIEPIVLRLLDRLSPYDHRLWIDLPQRVSLDPRLQSAGAIPYGKAWATSIEEALQAKSCLVLMIWTPNAARRFQKTEEPKLGSLAWEMHQAITNDAFVGARLEGGMDQIPPTATRLHWCDLRDWKPDVFHPEFEGLLETIVSRLGELDRRASRTLSERMRQIQVRPAGREAPAVDTELLLQYVDRTKQEVAVRALAQQILQAGEPRPLAVVGPEDEEPHAFLKRIFRSASELFGQDGALHLRLDWPRDHDFKETYRGQVSLELAQHPNLSLDEIADKLASKPQLVIFWSLLSSERWSAKERRRLEAWAAFWKDVGKARPGRVRVLPIVCVKLPLASRPWFDPSKREPLPPQSNASSGPSPRQVWTDIRRVEQVGKAQTGVAKLPILSPILRDEAEAWLTRPDVALDGLGEKPREAQARLKDLFSKRPKGNGLFRRLPPQASIRSFSDLMLPFVRLKSGSDSE